MRDGDELPFLLIRLSDWVPQVRSVAEQAVEQRCNPAYLQHFVDNIALLERQKQRQRGGSRRFELLERITSMLAQSQNRKVLFDGLQHQDYEVRRTCLKLLIETRGSDSVEIIRRIMHDNDVTNRRAAVELTNDLSLHEKLSDDSPGVSSAAEAALEDTIYELGSDVLWDCLTATSSWHVKRNVVRLLNRISKWDRISYLLLAASPGDGSVQELALKYVQAWEQQYRTTWQYSPRNAQQQDRFVKGFLGAREVLSAPLLETLQQCLSSAYDP